MPLTKIPTFQSLNSRTKTTEWIWSKVVDNLFRNFAKKRKTTEDKWFIVLYDRHKKVLKSQVQDFFNQKFTNFSAFMGSLNNFFYDEILPSYKEILEKEDSYYKFDSKEVEKYIDLLKARYKIDKNMIKRVNKVEQIDFTSDKKIESKIDNNTLDLISELEIIKKTKKYILSQETFNDIIINFKVLDKLLDDLKILFRLNKCNNTQEIQDIIDYYGLKYNVYMFCDENIYLYIYVINNVLGKTLEKINKDFKTIVSMAKIWLQDEEINVIMYNSMIKYLNME